MVAVSHHRQGEAGVVDVPLMGGWEPWALRHCCRGKLGMGGTAVVIIIIGRLRVGTPSSSILARLGQPPPLGLALSSILWAGGTVLVRRHL